MEPHEIVTSLTGEHSDGPRTEVRSITDDPQWFNGPPYAVAESTFDEYDIQGCSVTADVEAPREL